MSEDMREKEKSRLEHELAALYDAADYSTQLLTLAD